MLMANANRPKREGPSRKRGRPRVAWTEELLEERRLSKKMFNSCRSNREALRRGPAVVRISTTGATRVILGDKNVVKGESGKVVNGGPNDRIFIYYSDYGGPGVLGRPDMVYVYDNDFIDVVKKNQETGTYKEMVLYVEACESGSIFEGLMPNKLNIYVQTASGADENSWGTYCHGMEASSPPEYTT